jgi:hypothetical protein
MPAQTNITEGLVDPKAETRKQKLFKMLGGKPGESLKIGYEAGKLAGMGDKSGAAMIADLLMQQKQV